MEDKNINEDVDNFNQLKDANFLPADHNLLFKM